MVKHFCVWGISEATDIQTAEKGIEKTSDFFEQLGQPTRFSDIHIHDIDTEYIANRIANENSIGCLKKLQSDDIIKIIRLAQ